MKKILFTTWKNTIYKLSVPGKNTTEHWGHGTVKLEQGERRSIFLEKKRRDG